MTTLRSFQNEIDEIHHREVIKQRAFASTTADNKESKSMKGKAKDGSEELDKTDTDTPDQATQDDDGILVCCCSVFAIWCQWEFTSDVCVDPVAFNKPCRP